ncbi:MAG: dienelactone hydrolase family protein [Gemmataceae bacterium]
MCFDYDHEEVSRRSFLAVSTVTLAGIGLPASAAAELPPDGKALDDPTIRHEMVTFPSGMSTIKGFLARPRDDKKHRGILVLHGNPGLPEWVQQFTAGLAQAGYAGLVFDLNSRVVPDSTKLDKPLEFYISNTFDKQVTQDALAAIKYMKAQPFTKPGGVGWVGFCGGGRKGLVLSTQCKDIKAVVSFYGSVRFTGTNAKDPMADVMDVVDQIKVPVQGHYGLLDKVAPAPDAKAFERKLKAQKTPVEMYYYDKAGHGFYDFSWRIEQDGAFGYNAEAAKSARERTVKFLKAQFE